MNRQAVNVEVWT